ncbi:MAG: CRISPR system precrRNA processing endoribonuclease RAMP protein Cas6 [bacterium]
MKQKNGIIYDGKTKTLKEKTKSEKLDFSVPKRKIDSISIEFQTPTRIVQQGEVVRNPEFRKIVPNLLRRIYLLSYFHCNETFNIDFSNLLKKATTIKTKLEFFKFQHWERYSGRQKKSVPMDGFIGTVIYEGDLSPFYPYLKAGEVLHIGKNTAFGMGKYRIMQY